MAKWPESLNTPTPWQQRVMWAALTGLALYAIGWIAMEVISLATSALSYLQPLLIPVAVAAILAYLLDPLVEKITSYGAARTRAVLYVFALVFIPLAGILLWVVPQIYHESVDFGAKFPSYVESARKHALEIAQKYQSSSWADNPYIQQVLDETGTGLQKQLPGLPAKVWNFLLGSVEGFLGSIGFLLGLIVVPIYLFFFLRDAATISRRWSDYLPLRSSAFKDEVVSCLTEINSYLIAFFRGQIIVTTIDGTILAIALLIFGLPFWMLIGLLVAILQLIPYLGILLCWIPAVLIAIATWGDWQHPLWVTVIFVTVSNLDGLVIAPRIVGKSVGLHPVTIILSVLGWSLLVGGLLGALLAVPLTATLKVLLKRYVWQRSLIRRQIVVPVPQGQSAVIEIPE